MRLNYCTKIFTLSILLLPYEPLSWVMNSFSIKVILLSKSSCFYYAVSGTFDVLVDDYFADGIGCNASCSRILYAADVPLDVSLDGGVLEGAVAGRVEGAVFEYEVVGVA